MSNSAGRAATDGLSRRATLSDPSGGAVGQHGLHAGADLAPRGGRGRPDRDHDIDPLRRKHLVERRAYPPADEVAAHVSDRADRDGEDGPRRRLRAQDPAGDRPVTPATTLASDPI